MRKQDGRKDGKYIRDYTFEWQNPWCHGTSVIIDKYGRMH